MDVMCDTKNVLTEKLLRYKYTSVHPRCIKKDNLTKSHLHWRSFVTDLNSTEIPTICSDFELQLTTVKKLFSVLTMCFRNKNVMSFKNWKSFTIRIPYLRI